MKAKRAKRPMAHHDRCTNPLDDSHTVCELKREPKACFRRSETDAEYRTRVLSKPDISYHVRVSILNSSGSTLDSLAETLSLPPRRIVEGEA